MKLLRLSRVSYQYAGGFRISPLDLDIEPGEFLLLTGASGSGKSTLIRLLSMELHPETGSRSYRESDYTHPDNRQLTLFRRRVGMVREDLTLLQERSILENLLFRSYVLGLQRSQRRRQLFDLLGTFHLQHRAHAQPHELSAGEKKRAELACAVVGRPDLILADEPLAHLDQANKQAVLDMFLSIMNRGTAVIMASHDTQCHLPGMKMLNVVRGEVR